MKLFLEKLSTGSGLRKFKIRVQNDALTNTESGFEQVHILTNKNVDITGLDTNTLFRFNNHTLYDIDSFNHLYKSDDNEDIDFKLPSIKNKDFIQYANCDFALSKEISGSIEIPLDKYALFNRYQKITNTLISYDDAKFLSMHIEPEMSEEEIYLQLEKVFGSANETGIDSVFVGNEYTKIHPNIEIARTTESLPFSYVIETDITKNQVVGDNGHININLFKTKNHLKNDYNTFISDDNFLIWRRYKSIGIVNSDIWLSYSVDFADNTTNEYLTRNYETIEHLDGMVKYKGNEEGHKSNIYSIRIHNSGLNKSGEIYDQLRSIFEKSLFNLMTKIAPAHTQLWKIEYLDQ